jgi:hypothetical protein
MPCELVQGIGQVKVAFGGSLSILSGASPLGLSRLLLGLFLLLQFADFSRLLVRWSIRDAIIREGSAEQSTPSWREEKTVHGLATVIPPHNGVLSKCKTAVAEGRIPATYTTALFNFPNQLVKAVRPIHATQSRHRGLGLKDPCLDIECCNGINNLNKLKLQILSPR